MAEQPPSAPRPGVQAVQYKIQLPPSADARFCNAFRIDRDIFPGHHLFTFAAVIFGEVVGTISFAIENGLLVGIKANLLQYLLGLRAAQGLPEFVQPNVEIPITKDPPRAVDHIVLTQNAHAAEFAFYSWSWATTRTFQPESQNLIWAYLHIILRCTASLQIAWIEELYGDDAKKQPRQLFTFDATPKQL